MSAVAVRRKTRPQLAPHYLVLAALGLWGLVPALALILRPLWHGGVFTGVTGLDPIDQYQYLAWIRDTGAHGLAANLFNMTGGGHVFLQPMYAVSALLWRLGTGLQLAYLVWLPVSLAALGYGFWRYAQRMADTPARRAAILALALFFTSPLGWLDLPNTHWVAELQLAMSDGSVALQPWFAFATTLALGLMPLTLLGLERILTAPAAPIPRRLILLTALAGALVSWTHSWQGITLLLIMGPATLLARPRRVVLGAAAVPLLATALPLLYQFVLTRTDAAWRIAERVNDRPDLIVVTPQLAVLAPLLILALAGLRARPRGPGGWMLILWPLAALAVYRLDPEFPPHALQGLALPLGVLAVRVWPRGRRAAAAGALGIALLSLPGLAYYLKSLPPAVRANRPLFFQTPAEHAAFGYLAARRDDGGVLAPFPLALEVPAFTGHPVWDGHQVWTDDQTRPAQASAMFAGQLAPRDALTFLRRTGVRWVLLDCPVNPGVLAELRPVVSGRHGAGCARVLELRRGSSARLR